MSGAARGKISVDGLFVAAKAVFGSRHPTHLSPALSPPEGRRGNQLRDLIFLPLRPSGGERAGERWVFPLELLRAHLARIGTSPFSMMRCI